MATGRAAGFYGSCLLAFWGISMLPSTVAAPSYIPSNSAGKFPFLHIMAHICVLSPWQSVIWTGVRWYLIMGLTCIFWWWVMLSTFSCACCHLYVIFKMSIQVFCPLFNQAVWFFNIDLGYYTKWNKSEGRKRNKYLYMESKKQSRIQKKTVLQKYKKYRKRLTDTENKQVVATGEAGWGTTKMGEGN